MLDFRQDGEDLILKVYVQPRAAKNELAGFYQRALRIRLTASPVDEAANEACRAFLAEKLGVSRSRVKIISGPHSRHKQVRISGMIGAQLELIVNKVAHPF
jgi:hypothetical protein